VSKYSIFISLVVLLSACNTNRSDDEQKKDTAINADSIYHLLIFKKELKLEVWKAGAQNTFVDSYKIKKPSQLPIGQFDLNFDEKNKSLEIIFPNEFYKTKAYHLIPNQNLVLDKENISEQFFNKMENAQISEILIFPNDNRLKGDLTPCFACPHWMVEIYAFLNLKKTEYI